MIKNALKSSVYLMHLELLSKENLTDFEIGTLGMAGKNDKKT